MFCKKEILRWNLSHFFFFLQKNIYLFLSLLSFIFLHLRSHFLYMILDSKKTTRSQFSVPGLRDIHRNLKQEKNFNSRESFFRKSPFCTFFCINPGFGGPWDKLRKKNSYCHFHNALKECFWSNFFFEFHAWVQKCHFGNFSILPKWHFWSRAWHSKFFLPKTFFWSIMKIAITKFFHNLSQGPPNPGFMQEKVQKGDFLKKDSRELNFFSCFRFLWISRRSGTLNWERVVFLLSKIIYRKCELSSWLDNQRVL